MKFITSLFGVGSPKKMGRQYMKVGRNALFGIKPKDRDGEICTDKVPKPLKMLISKKGKLRHSKFEREQKIAFFYRPYLFRCVDIQSVCIARYCNYLVTNCAG